MTDLAQSYARCEEITAREARNFSYGIRLLPESKRRAMSALYAFARRVDDIGDGVSTIDAKREALSEIRARLERTAAGDPPADDPVFVALADTMCRYPVRADELSEVITGCELDGERQRWETYAELEHYCTCVAGSIGRLSLAIFGTDEPERGAYLANRLGIGLQIINILRDIREDREVMGRVYLPVEDLDRFGCDHDATGPSERLADLVRFEASRARDAYSEGVQLLELLDHRSRACVSAMAGIYRRLLTRIERDPVIALSRRLSLPTWEKAWVAARALAGAKL